MREEEEKEGGREKMEATRNQDRGAQEGEEVGEREREKGDAENKKDKSTYKRKKSMKFLTFIQKQRQKQITDPTSPQNIISLQ